MHREIAYSPVALRQESNLALYLMTALLGALIGLDLVQPLGQWLGISGLSAFPRGFGPYRFALIAAVLGGARVLYGSLQSLLEGRIGADLALAIAAIAAILINEPLVAAEVVFIGMVGECLEAYTFARTQRALTKIVEVFPRRCWLLRDGQEVRVLTSEVKVGDRVVVKPGAKVPVDGVVVEGRSALDTSPLTGESLPQDKGPGDEALAGSINQFGALVIEARKIAEQTVAGQVIEMTARALKDKAPLERTADRLARWFLPVVLGLAAVTFLGAMLHFGAGWFRGVDAPRLSLAGALRMSIYPTLSVLVVACPCGLILATPAAIIAALGRLAGTGILIKGGAALERLAQVNAFAFDKTGTITEGKLELGEVVALGQEPRDEVLRVAALAEGQSEHPIARLVVQEAEQRGFFVVGRPALQEFKAHPGAGVEARFEENTILVGNRRLLEEKGLTLSDEALAVQERLDAGGQTVLWVAKNGKVLGAIGARDRVRPEAAGVLQDLRILGIEPIVLLTGDRAAAANAVAAGLPLSDLCAELLPGQKADFIDAIRTGRARLRPSHEATDDSGSAGVSPSQGTFALHDSPLTIHSLTKVAMVGDGINDAPALARADVGLALGDIGADIAAEAGDVVLLGAPLRHLPLLVRLSRETVRIIRQNILVFAFGVNIVGVLLTAWLWPLFAPAEHSPLAAVLYHQLGSFLVLLNSMRLLWFERTATSPTWLRWKGRLQQADLWMEKHLDLGEWLHELEHHWRRALAVAVFLVLAAYAWTGLNIIRPDEAGVVRRFGRAVDDLEAGWHWRWPWPLESVTRVSRRVQTVEIGFRELPEKKTAGPLTWSSRHRKEQRRAEESVLLTGDGSLVDVLATVRYRITRPRVYLFEVQDAPELLRAAAESSLRSLAAGRAFEDLLTVGRASFQEAALERLRDRCRDYGPHGLGIEIEGIALLDLHPPEEVVDAYDEVARAMEGRDQKINDAHKRAVSRKKEAEAGAAKIEAQARAAAAEKTQEAAWQRARFTAMARARTGLPFKMELALYGLAIAEVWQGDSPGEVHKTYQSRRELALRGQAALSDFRLYWDAVAGALTGREIILIDAEKVNARRNLFLIDPDQFRPAWPMFLPGERGLPRPPQNHDEGP